MKGFKNIIRSTAISLAVGLTALPAIADDLRNVKRGEQVPAYRLPTLTGGLLDSEDAVGKVAVLLYLSAEQRSSELAAIDARTIINGFDDDAPALMLVTADVVHKSYFERFFEKEGINAPLAFDASRDLYGKLGVIVFPTTIVIDRDGRLAHVISTRHPDYRHTLHAYVLHAMGEIDDDALAERLKARTSELGSPRSLASRHRAGARLLREKGMLEAAEKDLIAARGLDPENVDVRLDMADLYLLMNKTDMSVEIIDGILETDPRHRRAKLLKGIALYRMERLEEAEAVLLEVLVLNPDPARTHYYLGRIYEDRHMSDKAIEHYREALARLLHEPLAERGRHGRSADHAGG